MPVRRKKSKARASDVQAWAGYLMSGCDFFDELATIGLTEATAEPLAEATWHEIGEQVFQHYGQLYRGYTPPARPYWAEEQFGPPSARRRRAGARA